MSINSVIHLFQTIDEDSGFREQIYQCKDSENLLAYLKTRGYNFNLDELEDAITYLHVQCQTLEEAQKLLHKADWLRFLIFMNEKSETNVSSSDQSE